MGATDSPGGMSPAVDSVEPRTPLLPAKSAGSGGKIVPGSTGGSSVIQVNANAASAALTQRLSTARDLLKSAVAVGVWYTSNIGSALLPRCAPARHASAPHHCMWDAQRALLTWREGAEGAAAAGAPRRAPPDRPRCPAACRLLCLNRYLLSNYGFRRPVFLTFWHMVCCCICASACTSLHLVEEQSVKSYRHMGKIALLAIVFCFSVVGGNISLKFMPVSFNQVRGAPAQLPCALPLR